MVRLCATKRFVHSRNTSQKLKRIARHSIAKKMLKIVRMKSAKRISINTISNTAKTPTKRNTHQLFNSRSQRTLPLVKLTSIPAPKKFVITINFRRWPPVKHLPLVKLISIAARWLFVITIKTRRLPPAKLILRTRFILLIKALVTSCFLGVLGKQNANQSKVIWLEMIE